MTSEQPKTDKTPKTDRGRRTRQSLLDAAAEVFGKQGFHETAIIDITGAANVAPGTFYIYFESKEEIYRAVVAHVSHMTRSWIAKRIADVPDRLTAEQLGLEAYIEFVREHKGIYRIIMEAQFVAEDAYKAYYMDFARAYEGKLAAAAANGEITHGNEEERAWALIGMSVFLGLRYGVWDSSVPPATVAEIVTDLIRRGLDPRGDEVETAEAAE